MIEFLSIIDMLYAGWYNKSLITVVRVSRSLKKGQGRFRKRALVRGESFEKGTCRACASRQKGISDIMWKSTSVIVNGTLSLPYGDSIN